MSKLIFKADEVKRIVEHTILHFAGQRPIAYTQNPVKHPAVILVHDQGVYLMSNAKEMDRPDQKGSAFCAYAEGCHPDKDADWWDNARDLVGGDDFAETLEWALQIKQKLDAGAKQITFNITSRKLELL